MNPTASNFTRLSRARRTNIKPALFSVLLFALTNQHVYAGSATWNLSPTSSEWYSSTNWTPATVPNGPNDTASFGFSNTTSIYLDVGFTEVSSVIFNPEASAFSFIVGYIYIGPSFTFSGPGVINNSGVVQNFGATGSLYGEANPGTIAFTNSASAGSLAQFTAYGGYGTDNGTTGGEITFDGTSSAGSAVFVNDATAAEGGGSGDTTFSGDSSADHATFTNNGGAVSGAYIDGGYTYFQDAATAASAAITSTGATIRGAYGGETFFWDVSTAADAVITCSGGTVLNASSGATIFEETATAGNATLIANGGQGGGFGGLVTFVSDSTGGTSRVEVFGNGALSISSHNAPGITIGSVEGDGQVLLGANNLTVGSNNLNTTFSGVIQDTGSLTKIGNGRLILTNANTYTGGTTVDAGILLVNNRSGSGTGSGNVRVSGGTFGGAGSVTGAVILGTGSGTGAFLAPGKSGVKPGTLTCQSKLTLKADATYKVTLDSRIAAADKVSALGVSIRNALILFNDIGASVIPPGTVFTVIDNTAATPIAGTFSNLADGSTVTVGSNTFQADYQGGDGNDLTLTVVP